MRQIFTDESKLGGKQIVVVNGFKVVWEIVPAARQLYLFKHDGGIFFKTHEGQHAFDCHPEENDARYKCHGNQNRNAYEYGMELVGSPPASILDPWVVNR